MDKQDQILSHLDSQLFEVFWKSYDKKALLNHDFIKDIFLKVDFQYKQFLSKTTEETILIKSLNVYDIALYTCEEHAFYLLPLNEQQKEELEKNENYISSLIHTILDKLIYNDFDNIQGKGIQNKYAVEISTINMFVNRMFRILLPQQLQNVKDKLLYDIFTKCMMLIKSSLSQLSDGLETEAMSTWRTLHELECVLKIIYDSDEEVAKAYFRHLEYGSYHRGEIQDEEQMQRISESIALDMEKLQVKKANKEKFINYGWLHWAKKIYKDEEVKFNFLGGLQKLADLTNYKKWYEIASDVTHSTPLLVYANKAFLYHSTLKITYESFFRIETLLLNFVMPKTNSTLLQNYLKFRNFYKEKVEWIYQQLSLKIKTNKD